MENSLVSIITVNYNNKAGLERTIKSVIGQEPFSFEYLVIDGGSTDGSLEVIQRYSKHMHHWVSEKDAGVYDAMNKGIRLSKGNYLLFLNSGDCFASSNVLQNLKDLLLERSHDVVYGNIITGGTVIRYNRPLSVYNMLYLGVCHQAMFLKKELFGKAGFYNTAYKVTADSCHLILCLARHNASYCYVDTVISDIEPGGMSTINKHENRKEKRIFMQKELSALADDYALLYEYRTKDISKRVKNFLKRRFR